MTVTSFIIVLSVNTVIAFCLWVCMRYDREQNHELYENKNKTDKK
jgi:hypothetical protein